MEILSVTKYKGATMCVELEGTGKVYLNQKIIEQFNLKPHINLPQAALDEIITADKKRRAREYALYLITTRDYSFKELYSKLEKSCRDKNTALEICVRLRDEGLVDDRKYAFAKARELFELKRVGLYKAKQELKLKGVSDELIAEVTAKYNDKEATRERLEELVEKKYERRLIDEKGVRSVKAALARQGYSFDDINAVLDLYDLDFSDNGEE